MPPPYTAGQFLVSVLYAGDALPLGAATTWGVTSALDVGDVSIAFGLAYAENMLGLHTTEVLVQGVLAKEGPSSTGPSSAFAVNESGEQAAATAPPNVSQYVRKVAPTVSGRLWGKAFLPGMNEGQVDDAGIISGAYLTDGQDKLDNFYNALTLGGMQPVVFPALPGAPREVTRFLLDGTVATQRRRLRR